MKNVTTAHFAASTLSQDTMASSVSPQSSPRIILPPPNPPFMFPARPSSSAPSSLSRTTGRRHQSAIEVPMIGLGVEYPDSSKPVATLPDFTFDPSKNLNPQSASRRRRPPPLPDFSFHPGIAPAAPATDSSLLSPSFTPSSPRPIPNHVGHRRGASEFVGGKLKSGESITLMSTSPTRSESGLASPTLTPSAGPRKHQRGHSHRRSGAISSHDLSLILQASPSPSSRGSSAPASPAIFHEQHPFPKFEDQETVEAAVEAAATGASGVATSKENVVLENPSRSLPELSPKPTTRARVGFSDTLEFIPRPLSMVSTDTASTVRPGHSVSGSVSSIASVTNSTNPDRDSSAITTSAIPRSKASSRPSTAGAVLERTSSLHMTIEGNPSSKRRNSILILNDLAQADQPTSTVSTPTKTPKRWTFFGFDSFATAGSPTRPRPASTGSSDTAARDDVDTVQPTEGADAAQDLRTSQNAAPAEEKKKSSKKRQKRVKSWAGSILTRKRSKSRAQKSKARRRSQTPPIARFAHDEDTDGDFFETTNQSSGRELRSNSNQPRSSHSGTAKHHRVRVEDDVSYPMIDLDAALGPFNTPTRDPQWEEAQRAGAHPKRQLHSAAGMRGFSGPGMHYHRRAESAPEMPPFEGGRFSIHRFGSSSTMADVFEEDEEDGNTGESTGEDSTSESQDTTTGDEEEGGDTDDAVSTPRQEQIAELGHAQTEPRMSPSIRREQSRSSLDLTGDLSNENSLSSFQNDLIAEDHASFIPPRREALFTSPWAVSDSALSSSRQDTNQSESTSPDANPIILSGPPVMPISPYPVSHSSSFPSPRSPMSYDAHRISTAPSSITDENHFRSLLMGEPGPEVVRLSIDVSSIISTNSTMTREGSLFAGVRPRNMPFHEQRPASFTSTAFGRRRSSLASLSRLISSAHGERSKLSMEVPFDNEAEKKSKASKSKRLTRMMQFWKPKASSGS